MEANFWNSLWENNDIGWHKEKPNDFLIKHFYKLGLKSNDRVFVPLCGKTMDIKWLLDNGFKVVGCELNEKAIKELFAYLNLDPEVKTIGCLLLYSAKNIDIFVGDIFNLDYNTVGTIDAIYDRAAIVALPSSMREKYSRHLITISKNASQLILSLEYNQNLMEGPPFSVQEKVLKEYYIDSYNFKLLERKKSIEFSKIDAYETIWLLKNKEKE